MRSTPSSGPIGLCDRGYAVEVLEDVLWETRMCERCRLLRDAQAGGSRKTVKTTHPPPKSSNNAPNTEKRSGSRPESRTFTGSTLSYSP
jgi:hypothetical protein